MIVLFKKVRLLKKTFNKREQIYIEKKKYNGRGNKRNFTTPATTNLFT